MFQSNLHCLANGANQLCGVASEGDVYAFNLLHRDFHVLDKGEVDVALSDDREGRIAGDGEGPLVDLEDIVFGPQL